MSLLDPPPIPTKRAVTVNDLPTTNLHYAHRGTSRDGRPMGLEGSASAYRYALAMGAHILDADVRRTADGVLVVGLHDTTTASLSDVTATVSSTPYLHLPQHYQPALVGSGWAREDFITVEQFLAEFGGRAVLDVELKSFSDFTDFAALVRKFGLQRSVMVNTSSATDALTVTANNILLHFVNCRSTAHIDSAATARAWMIDIATDANTALMDYAIGKGVFQRIIGGFVNTAGSTVSTATFSQLATRDARMNGHASDAVGYLFRSGGEGAKASGSIANAIRTGRRGCGWKVVNSSSLTDWLTPGSLLLRKGASGGMAYIFGDISGTPGASQTLTFKVIYDTLPTTTTQYAGFKIFSPEEDPANPAADTVTGYKGGIRADGVVFLNSIAVGGGTSSAVFTNLPGIALVAGTEYTVTIQLSDSGGTQRIRVTREDAVATISGSVAAGTVTSLPVNALAVALPTGTRLLLPDGTQVILSSTAAAGATSIPVSSVTVPALSAGNGLRASSGFVTEGAQPIWRGNYHGAFSTLTDGTLRLTEMAVS